MIDRKAYAGDYVQPGTPLGTIAGLSTIVVRIFVPENFIIRLKKGTPVSLQADVYPKIIFNGVIKNIIPVGNEARAFPVEIEIPNNKPQPLMAGMSMSARFKPATALTALTIPRIAIVGDFIKPSVFIIDSLKRPQLKPVIIGRDFGDLLEVTDGLKKGELVIISGQSNVEPGKILKDYTISQ